jgi:tetratricopeptide (TPR) repeat protein
VHRAGGRVAFAARRAARADRRLTRSARRALWLPAVFLAAATALSSNLTAPELENAAETARRAANALLRGNRDGFQAALGTDVIGSRYLTPEVWQELSSRQRERLRTVIRDHFVETLGPGPGTEAGIAFSSVRSEADAVSVLLGLRYPAGVLKTSWSLVRSGPGWTIRDVVLADPGISIAGEAMRSLGPERVRRLDPARETRAILFPRALGIAAIAAIVLLIGRRLTPPGRRILLLAAAAPAMLFVVDGFLALQRVRIEPYVLPETLPPTPWRAAEREAVRAQRDGRVDDAREAWEKAIAAGAPPAPALYQIGLALKAARRTPEARAAFQRALSAPDPAPGAGKELGLLALAEGDSSEARDRLAGYVAAVGPDPDSLSALAVAEANVGASGSALKSVDEARALTGDRWNGVALQARLYAKAGDARRTVEALRTLDAERKIDRESLRSDPAYLGIATDPIWIAFLSEPPK